MGAKFKPVLGNKEPTPVPYYKWNIFSRSHFIIQYIVHRIASRRETEKRRRFVVWILQISLIENLKKDFNDQATSFSFLIVKIVWKVLVIDCFNYAVLSTI
jgi:hypothetical protein